MVNQEVLDGLAEDYARAVNSAVDLNIAAEPEAQLTIPVANLFTRCAEEFGLGQLGLVREAQLNGVRPDFAATIDLKPCGWVELKAPGHSLDGDRWRGREKSQWELLAELDSLIVCNGSAAVLYNNGSAVMTCDLPIDGAASWDYVKFMHLLQAFTLAKATPIKRVSQLSVRLAPLARFIRIRLDEGLLHKSPPVLQGKAAWDITVHETTSSAQFSSDVAQVIAYSMAIAGLTGVADVNQDGVVTLQEAKATLEQGNRNVLAAALGPIIGIPELLTYIGPELGAIMRLVSSMDLEAIHNSKDSRGEPWLWFYEDFLAKYDPEARDQSGVYYTPTPVVQYQVRIVDDLLRNRFRQRLGFGSKSVVTLDPAAGSGTYPLAVIDKAVETAFEERGRAGSKQVADNLAKNILAFELLPGPYAVAHLRIGQRLAEARGQLVQFDEIGVFLTDTLEDPRTKTRQGLFGDALVLAESAEKARKIKAERPITVAIGNPPYDRVNSDSGGWVTTGDDSAAPLFDDIIKPAQERGVVFSAQASLYNLYVYFWRWAIWKALENGPDDKAIVSFITASSWLDGPAFVGLRQLAVDTASEIWVLDLGGDGRGARKEENVFDIQSPVAIVTLIRAGRTEKPASVLYKRISGTRKEKFSALDEMSRLDSTEGWVVVDSPNGESFIPVKNSDVWSDLPLLADLFPWQQPGIKYNRLWPVAPNADILKKRWKELLTDTAADSRIQKFVTSATGRNVFTKVGDLSPIAELKSDAAHQPIVRLGWRSFDMQWTFDDPRLAKTDSPALWQSVSKRQVFMASPWSARVSNGPAATVSAAVPDLHYFCNRGGKDVIPLFRDADCTEPNITEGLLDLLASVYGKTVSPGEFFAYCYAMIAQGSYSKRFWSDLAQGPVRVPVTKEAHLFEEAVAIGEKLVWLHTFGERYVSADRPQGHVGRSAGIEWDEPVTTLPEDLSQITYDEASHEIQISDGVLSGVRPEVWNYEVSGMRIMDKWLGARTRKGIGRSASKSATLLDRIRPTEWDDDWNGELMDLVTVLTETVGMGGVQAELLEKVLSSDRFSLTDLPVPSAAARKVPKTMKRDYSQPTLI